MATSTLGTNATTSLTSLQYLRGFNSGMAAADIATINGLILDQSANTHPKMGGMYFSAEGVLYLPNQRGHIKLEPGDYVGVDATSGWPIVVSKNAIANGPWTHT